MCVDRRVGVKGVCASHSALTHVVLTTRGGGAAVCVSVKWTDCRYRSFVWSIRVVSSGVRVCRWGVWSTVVSPLFLSGSQAGCCETSTMGWVGLGET